MEEVELLGQGAEAKVWKTLFCSKPAVVKERVIKKYRHPALEASISKKRLNQEARCLLRARKHGVAAPCVYHIDYNLKRIYMSFVAGQTLKAFLLAMPEEGEMKAVLEDVGTSLGKLHDSDVVHGDLTSSNIMLAGAEGSTTAQLSPCLIDFGLSYVSSMPEDKAVDLYVLERALESTHTQKGLMDFVLKGYKTSKKQQSTLTRLEDVRMRGRKRVMVG